MNINLCHDDLDVEDLKGGIRGAVSRTAACPGERCRRESPSGPVYTPLERGSKNVFVERGGECGPASQTPAVSDDRK